MRTLGKRLSSSMSEMMFMGLMAIMSRASWLSVNSMCCQLMCSRLYSSCSSLKTCRTKNCCRFSLAKLMHSCSKLRDGGARRQSYSVLSSSSGPKRWTDRQILPHIGDVHFSHSHIAAWTPAHLMMQHWSRLFLCMLK
ncbi:hypothetical protein EYF80_012066 [Liparis tanakae]|uniref:Uncharacterized protein n=1 Tax=Liparis tanakae TaxID=230148 RepID=A0A4Z2IIX0_9TELE|nr:hypothetical protein EYF80_012066 [Liparis tanakae]